MLACFPSLNRARLCVKRQRQLACTSSPLRLFSGWGHRAAMSRASGRNQSRRTCMSRTNCASRTGGRRSAPSLPNTWQRAAAGSATTGRAPQAARGRDARAYSRDGCPTTARIAAPLRRFRSPQLSYRRIRDGKLGPRIARERIGSQTHSSQRTDCREAELLGSVFGHRVWVRDIPNYRTTSCHSHQGRDQRE